MLHVSSKAWHRLHKDSECVVEPRMKLCRCGRWQLGWRLESTFGWEVSWVTLSWRSGAPWTDPEPLWWQPRFWTDSTVTRTINCGARITPRAPSAANSTATVSTWKVSKSITFSRRWVLAPTPEAIGERLTLTRVRHRNVKPSGRNANALNMTRLTR